MPRARQFGARGSESGPPAHPRDPAHSVDAVRRSGDVVRGPAGQDAIVLPDEPGIGASEFAPQGTAAPHAHEKHQAETVTR